jgi:hypothetical protein
MSNTEFSERGEFVTTLISFSKTQDDALRTVLDEYFYLSRMLDAIFESFAANGARMPDHIQEFIETKRAKDEAMREMERTRRHTLTAQERDGG